MSIEYPILTNAAGEANKTIDQIKRIISINPCKSAVVGSITLEERGGNPEPNFHYFEASGTSINRVGLKNPGAAYYIKNLPEVFKEFQDSLLILSTAYAQVSKDYEGIKTEELNKDPSIQFEILSEELGRTNQGRIILENNLSCPNIDEDYLLYEDLGLVEKILEKVEKVVGKKRYTIKVGYMPSKHLNEMVKTISCYDPFGIVAINTIPGC